MAIVFTDYFCEQIIDNIKDVVASGSFNGVISAAQILLVAAPFTPTNATTLGSLTEPTYTGYARQNAVYTAPRRRAEGGIATDSASLSFAMSAAGVTDVIYGYGVTDGGSPANLLAAEVFPGTPITLTDPLDVITMVSQIAFSGPNSGQMTISN